MRASRRHERGVLSKRLRKRLRKLQKRPKTAQKRSRYLPPPLKGNAVGIVRVGKKQVRQN